MIKKNSISKKFSKKQTIEEVSLKEMSNRINPNSDYYKHEKIKHPRFVLFLGAGASVESGVPTASEMIEEFITIICDNYCPQITNSDERDKWLKKNSFYKTELNKYPSLFERCFPKEVDRREYIESKVDGRLPSLGYLALAHLIRKEIIDTVITTNFDDLVYKACTSYTDTRPVVYSLGGFASEISGITNRPRIIKLHGDFLFSNLKNTKKELRHQDPNMSQQVQQIFEHNKGLVVVGYEGNDSSILELLNKLPKEKYLFWCVLNDKDVNSKVQQLLINKGGYIVRIKGYTDLMDSIRQIVGIKDNEFAESFINNFKRLIEAIGKSKSGSTAEIFEEIIKILPHKDELKKLLSDKLKSIDLRNYDPVINGLLSTPQINKLPLQINTEPTFYAEAYFKQGFSLAKDSKDLVKAEKNFRQAIANKPNYAEALFELGAVLIRQDKVKDAVKYLERAVDIDPSEISMLSLLAHVYKRLEKSIEFENCVKEIYKIVEENDWYSLASLNSVLGNKIETLDFLAKAIEEKPYKRSWVERYSEFEWLRDESKFNEIIIDNENE